MNRARLIPIQKHTVDAVTGKVTKSEVVNATLMPTRPGTCDLCGMAHKPHEPHNQRSLQYQIAFHAEHGRWPTWNDALAHCPQQLREFWAQELTARGESLDGKRVSA